MVVLILASFLLSSSPPYLSFPALFPWPVHILLSKRNAHGSTQRHRLTNINAAAFYNQCYLHIRGGVSERATPGCQQPNQTILPFYLRTLTTLSPNLELWGEKREIVIY